MQFSVIIPARYASSRLPGKLLKPIHGKPLIEHTYRNALDSGAQRVIIATDDEKIAQVAESFGAQVCMTDAAHESGTSRIAQVVEDLSIDPKHIVVNVQGDEPMIDPQVITQVAHNLDACEMPMATLCEAVVDQAQYLDPNCVKVVFDANGRALYFSRAPIPFFRESEDLDLSLCFKHIGIYAYRAGFLAQYLTLDSSRYEQVEKLEQLSVLHAGFDIHVAEACAKTGYGVDTQADLDKVIEALK